jgi:excisionase family DNA binding protein
VTAPGDQPVTGGRVGRPHPPARGGDVPYGQGCRMLTLAQLCEWFNITERHARKLVERDAIPYRKVGQLLRFPEPEIEDWSHPKRAGERPAGRQYSSSGRLPMSLIE